MKPLIIQWDIIIIIIESGLVRHLYDWLRKSYTNGFAHKRVVGIVTFQH